MLNHCLAKGLKNNQLKIGYMSQFKIFETERLIFKPTSKEDVELIFELLNTKKWIKFIGTTKLPNDNEELLK